MFKNYIHYIVLLGTFNSILSFDECLESQQSCQFLQYALNYYLTLEDFCSFDELEIRKALNGTSSSRHEQYHKYRQTFNGLCKDYENYGKGDKRKIIHLKNGIYNFLGINIKPGNQDEKIGFRCPEAAEITPCVCAATNGGQLNCSEVGNFNLVKDILDSTSFPSVNFFKFIYKSSSTSLFERNLPENLFGPLTFERIDISESGLEYIDYNAFNGSQTTLTMLLLDTNTKLNTFPFDSLFEYANLVTIYIANSAISSIPKVELLNCLTVFSVAHNKISSIASTTLSSMPNLEILDLGDNAIDSESIEKLNLASQYAFLYIDKNSLTDTPGFKCNTPYYFDLSYNYLTTFDQETYKPTLDAQGIINTVENPIECSQFGWVKELYNNYDQILITECWAT